MGARGGEVSTPPAVCPGTLLSPQAITHVVFSEGTKKLTNKATLWYVPLSLKNVDKVLEVPPVVVRRHLLSGEDGRGLVTQGVPGEWQRGWGPRSGISSAG